MASRPNVKSSQRRVGHSETSHVESVTSRSYVKAYSEWLGPSMQLSAWATQLSRNVAVMAGRQKWSGYISKVFTRYLLLSTFVMFVLHNVTKIGKSWSFMDFKIALLSNFKMRTNVYDRVFDTLITSLTLFFEYNIILRGQWRYSHICIYFICISYLCMLETCNCCQTMQNIRFPGCTLYLESRIGFRKKIGAKIQ